MAKLTAAKVKAAKFNGKMWKLYDEGSLYLLINKSGKYWRYDYRFFKKRKTLAIGVYPEISLAEAREKLHEAKQHVKNGVDPTQLKKINKINSFISAENSFQKIAEEWLKKQDWSDGHRRTVESRLKSNVFPWIGDLPVKVIGAQDVLFLCRRIEARGAIETAHRVKTICSQVFRYSVSCGLVKSDPCRDLKGALTPVKVEHMASITEPDKIGGLLRSISGYKGHEVTRIALNLAPHVFLRAGELRKAEWAEFNFDESIWKIPPERMKPKVTHLVPLSKQALELINGLKPLTGGGKYLFPSIRSTVRPMSENTVNGALRRLGYTKDEMTGHGFRSMFSTRFHEMGWPSQFVEKQLSHIEDNKVKAAYNYAKYLPYRKVMMQAWSNYLDDLRDEGEANLDAIYFYENYLKSIGIRAIELE